MGQYHATYNKTKREFISGHGLSCGAKLLEQAFTPHYAAGLMVLLCNSNGRGGGDLTPAGDYVEKTKGKYGMIFKEKRGFAKFNSALREVQGRWAGDEIVIQGDYAEEGDPGFIPEKERDEYKNISDLVAKALAVCEEFGQAISNDYFGDRHPEIQNAYPKKS